MKLDDHTKALLADPKRRRDWVIYQLRLQGRSMADVARKAEPPVRRQTLYNAFLTPYPRMEKLIADSVGLTPQQVFPERYDRDGLPVRRMGRPKKSTTKDAKDSRARGSRNVSRREAV